MNQDSIINQFINQFNKAFVPAPRHWQKVQMQIRAALTSSLQKMNLVTGRSSTPSRRYWLAPGKSWMRWSTKLWNWNKPWKS